MKVLVLGGDGYLGWPQALYLAARGHEVHIVDNFLRRRFDLDHSLDSLVPIASLHRRAQRWRTETGYGLGVHVVDITDHAALSAVIARVAPEAVVHFGEQRSAPYSMIDRDHAVHTQVNNVVGTLNLLYALAEHAPDCHRSTATTASTSTKSSSGELSSNRSCTTTTRTSYSMWCGAGVPQTAHRHRQVLTLHETDNRDRWRDAHAERRTVITSIIGS